MNAPERIWASGFNAQPSGRWWHETELKQGAEYVRADIHSNLALDALAAETQAAEAYDAQLKAEAELLALQEKMGALVDLVEKVAAMPISADQRGDVPVFGLDGRYITHDDIRKACAALAALDSRDGEDDGQGTLI